jgi:fimbrial chaperone protein
MRVAAVAARLILAVFLCAPAMARAGSFIVTPVRLDLGNGQSSAVLTLTNAEDAELTVQIRTTRWTQREGEDQYEPSRDLIAAPSVFRLGPNAAQVIRIGLRATQPRAVEQAFRLFLEEVPAPPEPGQSGVRIALRMGIPVFVAPAGAAVGSGVVGADLHWQASRRGDQIVLSARNQGAIHARLLDLDLADGLMPLRERSPLAYVLAGQERQWVLEDARHPDAIQVRAITDDGTIELTVPVDRH